MTDATALWRGHVAVFFMGITGVIARVSGFEAWHVTSYRVCLGALVLLLLWRRLAATPLPGRRAWACLAMGVLLSVHWYSFFLSIEVLGVMLGYALTGLQPLLIALMARVFLGERMDRKAALSLCIAVCGFAVLAWSAGPTGQIWRGVAISLVSFLLFALLVLFNREQVRHMPSLQVTALEMIGAVPLSLMMTLPDWAPADGVGWFWAMVLGVLCTGMAYVLYNGSMKVLSAPVAGLLLSLEVVYGFIGGWLIGDHLSGAQIVAAILISNILVFDVFIYGRRLWFTPRAADSHQRADRAR